jgi:hypothetical protein
VTKIKLFVDLSFIHLVIFSKHKFPFQPCISYLKVIFMNKLPKIYIVGNPRERQ